MWQGCSVWSRCPLLGSQAIPVEWAYKYMSACNACVHLNLRLFLYPPILRTSTPHRCLYLQSNHYRILYNFISFYLVIQQYVNCELPDVQAGFRKGRGTRDQIANNSLAKSKRVPEKHLLLLYWLCNTQLTIDCVDHNKLWKILQEMGTPDHLTCLLRNLYSGQEATVRTRHGTTDWFQIEIKAIYCHPAYLTYMQNTPWETLGWMKHKMESRLPAINNLRFANDSTLMAESKKELKSPLMKMQEESEKVGLKLNIQKLKIMASSPITSWQIDGEIMETVRDFIFLGSKITADGDCSHEIKTLTPWKESYDQPR